MKIHQLPMGARFQYEETAYVKTGPLLATGPAERQDALATARDDFLKALG